ncbi:MAG: glycosyl hydrolase [Blastocatellia bacterium]
MTISNLQKYLLMTALVVFSGFVPAQNAGTNANGVDALQRSFESPPDDARIMMRWWWYGPAVTKPELEREMRVMKDAGIGGFEVQPVYPVALDDAGAGIKNLPFLSDEYLDALRFTSDKAHELGLRMDLTLGSGWPFGGPMVPVGQAAGRLRIDRVKLSEGQRRVPLPALAEGEKLVAAFLGMQEIIDIKEGVAWLPAQWVLTTPAERQNELRFFIASRTGQQVKRAAIGGEGFVIDHYDRAATDNYLKNVGDRLMQAFGSNRPYAIFCDSLEVFGSDWTGDFLSEFQKRRGYDLKPLLPALASDAGSQTADIRAIRHDWGQTLTELLNERFLTPMHNWSKQNRTLFRIQGYGVPPMTLSGNAMVDLPEGEGPQWKVVRASRWASSASHLYGKPVTSSETWTWLHSPSFRATPLDVKAEADLHFLEGINQLIGHGWPYTAPGVEYPGWRFYAAAVFGEKNPWWIAMPEMSRYLQRVSYLMRQGQPANDVALYLPTSDAWASFSAGRVHLIETLKENVGTDVISRILEAGYNFDFFDDEAMRNIGRVEKNALALGANKYKAVVLPNVERIPLETLRKLEEFARNGGVVIATRRLPSTAPGFKATETENSEVRVISQRLFQGQSPTAHFVDDESRGLAPKLVSLLRPDVALVPAVTDVGFIHRHTDAAEIYFLANTSNARQRISATFRVQQKQAEWWNPFDGSVAPAEAQVTAEGVKVPLDLEPYGSRVLVFTSRKLPAVPPVSASLKAAIDLSSGWQVSFGQGKPAPMDKLRSWTESGETRYFSGEATYEKGVIVPDVMLQRGAEVLLDFGEGEPIPARPLRNGMRAFWDGPIRDAAVVYVNDVRAGSVWCPPYQVNVTKLLKRGENRIRIVVGNTAINYLAGHRLPDYKLLNLRYGVRFEPQDMENLQPLPSGLLGTIKLVAR